MFVFTIKVKIHVLIECSYILFTHVDCLIENGYLVFEKQVYMVFVLGDTQKHIPLKYRCSMVKISNQVMNST